MRVFSVAHILVYTAWFLVFVFFILQATPWSYGSVGYEWMNRFIFIGAVCLCVLALLLLSVGMCPLYGRVINRTAKEWKEEEE